MMLLEYVFCTVFAGAIGIVVYRGVKSGSLRGVLFKAKTIRKVGEADGEPGTLVKSTINVYALQRDSDPKMIGIEISSKSFASFQITPIVMSGDEAKKLIVLLQEAIQEPTANLCEMTFLDKEHAGLEQ